MYHQKSSFPDPGRVLSQTSIFFLCLSFSSSFALGSGSSTWIASSLFPLLSHSSVVSTSPLSSSSFPSELDVPDSVGGLIVRSLKIFILEKFLICITLDWFVYTRCTSFELQGILIGTFSYFPFTISLFCVEIFLLDGQELGKKKTHHKITFCIIASLLFLFTLSCFLHIAHLDQRNPMAQFRKRFISLLFLWSCFGNLSSFFL